MKNALAVVVVLAVLSGLGCDRLPSYAQWERHFSGPDFVEPVAIIRAPDSGYAVIAEIRDRWTSATGVWLLRLDDEGDTLWTRGWAIGQSTVPDDVLIAQDGEYCVSGRTNNPCANTPFLALADEIWGMMVGCDTWPELTGDGPCHVSSADSGALMLACQTHSPNPFRANILLQRIAPYGYVYWSRFYTLDTTTAGFRDLTALPGGNYCLVGAEWAMGVSRTGDSLWFRDYRSLGSVDFHDACATSDGGLLLSGSVYTETGARMLCARTDSLGSLVWSYQVSDPPSGGRAGIQSSLGACYVVGSFGRDMESGGLVIKLNSQGQPEWQRELVEADDGWFVAIAEAPDRDLVVLGYSGNDGLCLVKMTP